MINIIDNKVQIINEDNVLIEQFYIADEFVWLVNGIVTITKETNGLFYEELDTIMNSNYEFQSNTPSFKTKNKIIWLSDQYCDIEDEEELSKINRLIIEKQNNEFIIYVENPFLDKLNIKRNPYTIAFSPLGNGYYSKNIDTSLSFQDDIAIIYQTLLHNKSRVLK